MSESGLQLCPDKAVPKVKITLGTYRGYELELDVQDYTMPSRVHPGFSIIAIIPSPLDVNVWILGNTFLKRFYIDYHIKNKVIRMTKSSGMPSSVLIPYSEQPSYFARIYGKRYCILKNKKSNWCL